jgi:hypothetical protein
MLMLAAPLRQRRRSGRLNRHRLAGSNSTQGPQAPAAEQNITSRQLNIQFQLITCNITSYG